MQVRLKKRIYKDDVLVNKTYKVSNKYEHEYVKMFIQAIRKDRKKTIKFLERLNQC